MIRLKLFANDSVKDMNSTIDDWVTNNKPTITSAQFKNAEGYYKYEILVTYDDAKEVTL